METGQLLGITNSKGVSGHDPGLTKGHENPHPHPYPLPEGEGITLPFKGAKADGYEHI